jgi:predicted porin
MLVFTYLYVFLFRNVTFEIIVYFQGIDMRIVALTSAAGRQSTKRLILGVRSAKRTAGRESTLLGDLSMKKHLIAIAVAAAVAAPAMAQNVTVGGVLDITAISRSDLSVKDSSGANNAALGSQIKASSTTNGISTAGAFSTSVLNISGSEDLGGGLRASFFVNQSINSNDGSLGNRDRFLQLSGGFGSLKVGRYPAASDGYGAFAATGTVNTAGTSESGAFDLEAGTMGRTHALAGAAQTTDASSNAGGNDLLAANRAVNNGFGQAAADTGAYGRQNGVIEFTTPQMSGLSATLTYASNKVDRDGTSYVGNTEARQHGVRVDYSAGPLAAAYSYAKRKVSSEQVAGTSLGIDDNGDEMFANDSFQSTLKGDFSWIGVRYNLGPVTVFASYADREDERARSLAWDAAEGASATTVDIKLHTIGVQVPLGNVMLFASMYDGKDGRTNANNDDRELSGYQLGSTYALSKRTRAYLVYGQNQNDSTTTGAGRANVEFKQTSLGLVHSF